MTLLSRRFFAHFLHVILTTLWLGQVQASADNSIAGTWKANFNGHAGTMEISGQPGSYRGRFNIDRGWENMLDFKVQGTSIVFRRAHADQRYQGTIKGNRMSGIFVQQGGSKYAWEATTNKIINPPPTQPPPVTVGSIAGKWKANFNGHTGTMEISGQPGSYRGRFNIDRGWENMLDFKVQGNSIVFRRAHADQRFQGTIKGRQMAGSFIQQGVSKFQWSASR